MLSRRAVLASLAAIGVGVGSRPAAAAAPHRIICLEWTTAEMAISLGVAPLAVADTKGYHDWVAAPALPTGTLDLGSRGEPNLELVSLLRPDLIATAYGYGLDESTFTRIAPLVTVPFYDGTGQPYQQAEAETRTLGAVLGREREAEDVIARTNATISRVKATLASRQKQPIAVVSMFDDRHVRIYGKGGLFQDIFDRIGLENGWTAETSSWGFSTVGIDALAAIGNTQLVTLDPIPAHIRIRIDHSSLWANLPCVKAGKVVTIPPVWPFGGLAAAARFASLLEAALT